MLAKSGTRADDPGGALAHRSYDGLTDRPALHRRRPARRAGLDGRLPGGPPFVRGPTAERAGWDVRQRVVEPDPAAANRAVLAELDGGASSLWLRLGPGPARSSRWPGCWTGCYLDLAPVALDAGTATVAAAEALLRLLAERGA